MISFVMLGCNNLKISAKFYDRIFVPLNLIQVISTKKYIGYANKNKLKDIEFYITKPLNKKRASFGNGSQITFLAKSKKAVDKFHFLGLANGGTNEGFPGIRSGDYYSYIRDLDGNKICAKFNIINNV